MIIFCVVYRDNRWK